MQAVIVDTDVLSFIFKGDTRADLYEPQSAGFDQLYDGRRA